MKWRLGLTTRWCPLLLASAPWLFAGGWGIPPAHADLTVIYDSGHTRPITDYLEMPVPAQTNLAAKPLPSRADLLKQVLPIRTPEMSPGAVVTIAVKLPYLDRPLFLIGSDEFSRRWLAQYRERLRKLRAVGMLIQAENEADIESIRAIAGDLDILPASGSELAQQLQLRHYPVLISSTRIEQ